MPLSRQQNICDASTIRQNFNSSSLYSLFVRSFSPSGKSDLKCIHTGLWSQAFNIFLRHESSKITDEGMECWLENLIKLDKLFASWCWLTPVYCVPPFPSSEGEMTWGHQSVPRGKPACGPGLDLGLEPQALTVQTKYTLLNHHTPGLLRQYWTCANQVHY